MAKHKKKYSEGMHIAFVAIGLLSLSIVIGLLLHGKDVVLFSPKGVIAHEQLKLMLLSGGVLLGVALPSLFLLYYFAWKYRESNQKAVTNHRTHSSRSLVITIWAVPTLTMILLASVMWPASHRLAPQKAISSSAKPLTIQVIAMRWKWLFIYPDQNIATVNFAQVPMDTPLQFDITADETPMSSFWIPKLGGQLYAMTGHVNRLSLLADVAGDYRGSSAEINGDGFSGMKFITRAGTQDEFDAWADSIKQSEQVLDSSTYQQLLKPSQYNSATYYSEVEPDLYATMLSKYAGSHSHHTENE